MSLADKKGINLSDGFKLIAKKPLDARQVLLSKMTKLI